jgi:hypothetical protein
MNSGNARAGCAAMQEKIAEHAHCQIELELPGRDKEKQPRKEGRVNRLCKH